MTTQRITLDPSELDTLLLDSSSSDRLESMGMLMHLDDTRRSNLRWQRHDEEESSLLRSWQDEF